MRTLFTKCVFKLKFSNWKIQRETNYEMVIFSCFTNICWGLKNFKDINYDLINFEILINSAKKDWHFQSYVAESSLNHEIKNDTSLKRTLRSFKIGSITIQNDLNEFVRVSVQVGISIYNLRLPYAIQQYWHIWHPFHIENSVQVYPNSI